MRKRIPKRITLKWLISRFACREAQRIFINLYPEGIDVTPKLIRNIIKTPLAKYADWIVCRVLNKHQAAAYDDLLNEYEDRHPYDRVYDRKLYHRKQWSIIARMTGLTRKQ